MRWRHWFFFAIGSFSSFAIAKHPTQTVDFENAPWRTGPLISPSGHITPAGSVNIEPYYTYLDNNGSYNSQWKFVKDHHFRIQEAQIYTSIGITDWMDFAISPAFGIQTSQKSSSFVYNDLQLGFDIQFLNDTQNNYLPALKIGLREVFPIAKYQRLSKSKHGTDAGGVGSYQSEFVLAASRLIHLRGKVWLNLRWVFACDVMSRVHVHGRNAFGGGADTHGYVYPAFRYGWDFAGELTLTKNWVFACDLVGEYHGKRTFKGHKGTDDDGHIANLTRGSAALYQIAPALEYNWSADYGVIAGAWLTIAGRNIGAFNAAQAAVNINF